MIYIEDKKIVDKTLTEQTLAQHTFTDCVFENCVIERCRFERCSFVDCLFRDCRIVDAKSLYSELRQAAFENCTITHANWAQWEPNSRIAEPFELFRDCTLRYNWFENFDLNRFDFTGNKVVDSLFADCKMQKTNFHGCDLTRTEFIRSDLQGADFREAFGYRVSIRTNQLKGAYFSSVEALSLLAELEIHLD